MTKLFTCQTENCFYNINPVLIDEPSEQVLCGACFNFGEAIDYIEPKTKPKKKSATK